MVVTLPIDWPGPIRDLIERLSTTLDQARA